MNKNKKWQLSTTPPHYPSAVRNNFHDALFSPAKEQELLYRAHQTQEPTDELLIKAIRNGEEWAMTTLFDQYSSGMLRYSKTVISHNSFAETLVKKAWEDVLNGLAEYDGQLSIKAWIFQFLHTHLSRFPKVSSSHAKVLENKENEPERHKLCPAVYEQPIQTLHILLYDLLSSMSPIQRQIITLRDMELFSSHDISHILNITEHTYRIELHSARRLIYEHLFLQSRS